MGIFGSRVLRSGMAGLLPLLAAAGCAAPAPGAFGALALGAVPESLASPAVQDWRSALVTGRAIRAARQASSPGRRVQAYPTAGFAALMSGTPYSLAGAKLGGNAGAAAYYSPFAAVQSCVFYITQSGDFLRVDTTNPTGGKSAKYSLGGSYSRCNVALSQYGDRAYVVSDAGAVTQIDTTATPMTGRAVSLATTAAGSSVWIDPFTSSAAKDSLYVADNGGGVTAITGTATALTKGSTYAVATGVVPLAGRSVACQCPAVVLNGEIYMGDNGGTFHVYNIANAARRWDIGAEGPIDAPAAVDTDAAGVTTAVFFTSGQSAYWFDVATATSTRSLPLYLDNNSNANKGTLRSYNYSSTTTAETLTATDDVTVDTASGAINGLAGTPTRFNSFIEPAYTDVRPGATAAPGPLWTWLRFTGGSGHTAGTQTLLSAVLTLTPHDDGQYTGGGGRLTSFVPGIHATGVYQAGSTSTLWTNATALASLPAATTADVGRLTNPSQDPTTTKAVFRLGRDATWDVTSAIGALDGTYGLLLEDEGQGLYWSKGPVAPSGTGKGKKAATAANNYAASFEGSASASSKPTLTLTFSNSLTSTPTIATPVVVDSLNQFAYVNYANAVFRLSYASASDWSDSDPNVEVTAYNRSSLGRTSGKGATFQDSSSPKKNWIVDNPTALQPSIDFSALYMLDRYPTTTPDPANGTTPNPAAWDYKLCQFSLGASGTNLNGSTDCLNTGVTIPSFTGRAKNATGYLLQDFFFGGSAGNLYFGLDAPSGTPNNAAVLQYQP